MNAHRIRLSNVVLDTSGSMDRRLLGKARGAIDGPILVITDAWIDRVRIKREHAFLIPAGAALPFPARGPVFRFS